MSRTNHTITVNHDIDLEITCARCGGRLVVEGTDECLTVNPCVTCEDAVKDTADSEGYSRGVSDTEASA